MFKFTGASLKLPWIPELSLPPVGQGWFDNVYLDDTLRINREIRGNTAVYVKHAEAKGRG